MSRCPFGQQALKMVDTFSKTHKKSFNVSLAFVSNLDEKGQLRSLHGPEEVKENMLWQYLWENNQPDLVMTLIDHHLQQKQSLPVAQMMQGKKAIIDLSEHINTFTSEPVQKGTKQALIQDAIFAQKYGITASPTFIVNDKWIASLTELENHTQYKGISQHFSNKSSTTSTCK